jgi:hypothetical protein
MSNTGSGEPPVFMFWLEALLWHENPILFGIISKDLLGSIPGSQNFCVSYDSQ